MGQGEIVAHSSLGAHLQRRGTPVNVIEFEEGDFAQAQSQPCKQQQNGVVATTHGGAAIDAGQQPVNLIGGNRTRNGIHRPVGDDGNGGDQIRRSLVAIPHVVQKRAQRGGHELCALLVHPRRHVLNESHDVASAQNREGHLTCTEAMLKEGAEQTARSSVPLPGPSRVPRPGIARRSIRNARPQSPDRAVPSRRGSPSRGAENR